MTPRKRAPSQTCDRWSASEMMDFLFTAFLGEHTSALWSTRGEHVCAWRPVARLVSYGGLVLIACTVIPNESRQHGQKPGMWALSLRVETGATTSKFTLVGETSEMGMAPTRTVVKVDRLSPTVKECSTASILRPKLGRCSPEDKYGTYAQVRVVVACASLHPTLPRA